MCEICTSLTEMQQWGGEGGVWVRAGTEVCKCKRACVLQQPRESPQEQQQQLQVLLGQGQFENVFKTQKGKPCLTSASSLPYSFKMFSRIACSFRMCRMLSPRLMIVTFSFSLP